MKIKKGDTVIVTAGKDKGKKGKIDAVLMKERAVVVAGMNAYKRHMKKRDEKNPGGIIDRFRPIPVGNVALICPSCKQPTRAGYRVSRDGKERICKKCEATL